MPPVSAAAPLPATGPLLSELARPGGPSVADRMVLADAPAFDGDLGAGGVPHSLQIFRQEKNLRLSEVQRQRQQKQQRQQQEQQQ